MWPDEHTPADTIGLSTPEGRSWSSDSSSSYHSSPMSGVRVESPLGICLPHDHIAASIGSLTILNNSAGREVDDILKERITDYEQQDDDQQQQQQQRGRMAGKKRAVFGRMQRLLSRSRSASKEVERFRAAAAGGGGGGGAGGAQRVFSLRGPAPAAAARRVLSLRSTKGNNSSSRFRSEFVGRRLYSLQSKSTTSEPPATAKDGEGSEGYGYGRSSSPGSQHRAGREENFHLAMKNKLVRSAFTAFCERTLSSENVEFVRQVCVYRVMSYALCTHS